MKQSRSASALRLALLLAGIGAMHAGDVLAQTRTPGDATFVAFGDSGYIPAYDEPDADEPPARTREEFIRSELAEWSEDHNALADFEPSPMVFETRHGGWLPASGLYATARAMTDLCSSVRCDFALMLGDNIYPDGATLGADGLSDARRFRDVFERPYAELGAGVEGFQIYATLGNHDWHVSREAAAAQVKFLEDHPKFHMNGFFYSVKPPAGGGQIELFVLDTEMLLASTTVTKAVLAADGSEVATTALDKPDPWTKPRTTAEKEMAAWLDRSLKNSTAKWKIVLGHHPLWSSAGSKFAQARALRALILPSLCRYADAYFAGHEHTLEVHTDSCQGIDGTKPAPLPQLVSGAAAKQRPLHRPFMAHQARGNPQIRTHYARGMLWGFMQVTLAGDELTVEALRTPQAESSDRISDGRFPFRRRSGL